MNKFHFFREVPFRFQTRQCWSEKMEEAMMLFLGQEPQQMNFYIITDQVCSLLSILSGRMAGHP